MRELARLVGRPVPDVSHIAEGRKRRNEGGEPRKRSREGEEQAQGAGVTELPGDLFGGPAHEVGDLSAQVAVVRLVVDPVAIVFGVGLGELHDPVALTVVVAGRVGIELVAVETVVP